MSCGHCVDVWKCENDVDLTMLPAEEDCVDVDFLKEKVYAAARIQKKKEVSEYSNHRVVHDSVFQTHLVLGGWTAFCK